MKDLISSAGWNTLAEERDLLFRVERPKVVEQVAAAAAEGDRSENAEYIYGKKRMREIDRRIQYIDRRLKSLEVQGAPVENDRVRFLSKVEVELLDLEELQIFTLVGPDESDPDLNRISYKSPVGRALMGKEVDEFIEVHTPGGIRQMIIIQIFSE